jgi:hypothetical protein
VTQDNPQGDHRYPLVTQDNPQGDHRYPLVTEDYPLLQNHSEGGNHDGAIYFCHHSVAFRHYSIQFNHHSQGDSHDPLVQHHTAMVMRLPSQVTERSYLPQNHSAPSLNRS